MNKKILVVGGALNDGMIKGEPWSYYSSGRIVSINTEVGEINDRLAMSHTPDFITTKKSDAISPFKAAEMYGDVALICTTTEVFEVDAKSWSVKRKVSHPKMNDVHHVISTEKDTLLVVSTGLDALLELTWDSDLVNAWPLCDRAKSMLEDEVDYRNVECTKPHTLHPNYVFTISDEIYVTCFKTASAVCVNKKGIEPFFIGGDVNIHDGIVRGESVFFTSTNGFVHELDKQTKKVKNRYDLNGFYDDVRPLGWCRGIEILDKNKLAVGFSTLRETNLKENLRRVIGLFDADKRVSRKSRVDVFDIGKNTLVSSFGLTNAKLDALFSIHLQEK